MDERIISLLEEQNALLKKHLWRFRFSLLFLMLMTTGLCIGLGFLVYKDRPNNTPPRTVPLQTFLIPRSQNTTSDFQKIPAPKVIQYVPSPTVGSENSFLERMR